MDDIKQNNSDDLEKLKTELEACKKNSEEYLNGWKRERADFINYKKDEAARFKDIVKFANEKLMLKLLEVLDNLELAQNKIPEDLRNNDWAKGVLQIKQVLADILKKENVEAMDVVGKKFNPEFHEVVSEEESQAESGNIIEEVRKGYLLNSKVIRPARVKVAK